MPDYIDFALDLLIAQTRITQPFAHRRLNTLENSIVALARQWRLWEFARQLGTW